MPSFAVYPQLPSAPINGDRVDVDKLVSELVSYEKIDELYSVGMDANNRPESYTFDPSVYILKYNVSSDYWDNVSSCGYDGLTSEFDSKKPTVLIPLYGETENVDGATVERVVGYAKLIYGKGGYSLAFEGASLDSGEENYSGLRYSNFYEVITEYVAENGIEVKQIILLCHSSSRSIGHATVAAIKTETEEFILDFSNSSGKNRSEENGYNYGILGKPTAYSIEEFRALRIAREAEQKPNDFYAFFGNFILPIIILVVTYIIVPLAVVAILITAIVITVKLIKKRKKHQS
jgi:hypothetical protein